MGARAQHADLPADGLLPATKKRAAPACADSGGAPQAPLTEGFDRKRAARAAGILPQGRRLPAGMLQGAAGGGAHRRGLRGGARAPVPRGRPPALPPGAAPARTRRAPDGTGPKPRARLTSLGLLESPARRGVTPRPRVSWRRGSRGDTAPGRRDYARTSIGRRSRRATRQVRRPRGEREGGRGWPRRGAPRGVPPAPGGATDAAEPAATGRDRAGGPPAGAGGGGAAAGPPLMPLPHAVMQRRQPPGAPGAGQASSRPRRRPAAPAPSPPAAAGVWASAAAGAGTRARRRRGPRPTRCAPARPAPERSLHQDPTRGPKPATEPPKMAASKAIAVLLVLAAAAPLVAGERAGAAALPPPALPWPPPRGLGACASVAAAKRSPSLRARPAPSAGAPPPPAPPAPRPRRADRPRPERPRPWRRFGQHRDRRQGWRRRRRARRGGRGGRQGGRQGHPLHPRVCGGGGGG
jgi:hypothetical protein